VLLMVIPRAYFYHGSTRGELLNGELQCGACFSSLQDSLDLDAFDMILILCATLSHTQKYRISIDLECWHLMVLFAIPTAVALLQYICIFGCGWPNSSSVIQNIMPSLQLRVEKEGAEFGFGSGGDNKMKNGT
jgi:hypothetical protein